MVLFNPELVVRDKKVHTFPQGTNGPKMNVIALLEFELAYYDVKVLHANRNTIGTFFINDLF